MGIITLLDIVSIISQDRRRNILKELSKQTTASTNLPLNKGKRL